MTDSDGSALRPSLLQKNISQLFPKLKRKQYPEEERRYYFNLEDSREFLIESFLQAKTEPEKVRKNRAFVMLAKYWLEQSEGRKELENMDIGLKMHIRNQNFQKNCWSSFTERNFQEV